MVASLHSEMNANGDRELELRLKESSSIQQVVMNAWNSEESKQIRSNVSEFIGSAREKYDKRKKAKAGGKDGAEDSASIISSSSKILAGSKVKKTSTDVRVDSGFSET